MPKSFIHHRRVEFYETDLAGIVHFTNFFRYMEAAEAAFFRELGFSITGKESLAPIGWPRGEVSCRFESPLKFEDVVEVHLRPHEIREKTITYELTIYRRDGEELVKAAFGKSTAICISHNADTGQMKAVPIPKEVRAQIESYFGNE